VTVEVCRFGNTASIVVRDSGQGIDPSFLPHVFERFRQAESTTTRAHGGLGLGLAIVRYIVEMHGGRVRAASGGIGKGATFTIELPVAARAKSAEKVETQSDQYCDLSGTRVMFVDDQDETRTFVRAVLEYCGAEVKDFGSAAEAIEALRSWQPDVIVTDIAMPHEDGHAFARKLAALDWQGPILALTAFGIKTDDEHFAEQLTKPIDPFALAQAVQRALSGERPSRPQ
jgi:CheY-like chemotaxis protein